MSLYFCSHVLQSESYAYIATSTEMQARSLFHVTLLSQVYMFYTNGAHFFSVILRCAYGKPFVQFLRYPEISNKTDWAIGLPYKRRQIAWSLRQISPALFRDYNVFTLRNPRSSSKIIRERYLLRVNRLWKEQRRFAPKSSLVCLREAVYVSERWKIPRTPAVYLGQMFVVNGGGRVCESDWPLDTVYPFTLRALAGRLLYTRRFHGSLEGTTLEQVII